MPMGGRGAMSSTGKSGLGSVDAKDPLTDKQFDALKKQAAGYGIALDDSLKQLPGQSVVAAYEGVRDVKKAFSKAPDDLFTVKAEARNSRAYAWASPLGGITVNSSYFSDYQGTVSSKERDKTSGWSPGGSVKSVTAHEAGHVLEAALIRNELGLGPGSWSAEATRMWNKGTQAGKVVREAVSRANKASGTKMKKADVISGLSRYAASRSSASFQNPEALAEAVSDFVSNRGTSRPISQHVWDILKEKLD